MSDNERPTLDFSNRQEQEDFSTAYEELVRASESREMFEERARAIEASAKMLRDAIFRLGAIYHPDELLGQLQKRAWEEAVNALHDLETWGVF